MSEKFYEALREGAEGRTWCKNSFWRKRRAEGIDATIEALKEMMVGGLIRGSLRHVVNLPDAPHTMLDNSAVKDPAYGEALFEGHIDTNGEEVVMLCLKSRL